MDTVKVRVVAAIAGLAICGVAGSAAAAARGRVVSYAAPARGGPRVIALRPGEQRVRVRVPAEVKLQQHLPRDPYAHYLVPPVKPVTGRLSKGGTHRVYTLGAGRYVSDPHGVTITIAPASEVAAPVATPAGERAPAGDGDAASQRR